MKYTLLLVLSLLVLQLSSQEVDSSLLTIDRIYSGEFRQEYAKPISWTKDGNGYISLEASEEKGGMDMIKYDAKTGKKSLYLSASSLSYNGKILSIESFNLSDDESKVLIFNNSSRVWRSNTKGDYYVYDFDTKKVTKLGKDLESSSLMFAKFSGDNQYVAYVHKFNLYLENFAQGTVVQLTKDGNGDIINGTFDWVYEEEFGKRDGFIWSPNNKEIAFWQLDASETGTFYMINNTDSIYSNPIPLQYPKVGQDPSSAKLGLINIESGKIQWINLEGDSRQNYIPGIQWVSEDQLLIQQLNRKQNELIIWAYEPSKKKTTRKVYTEKEDTWVDLQYPDISARGWEDNDLSIVENGSSFLRMTEQDKWRHVYKVNIATGEKSLVTDTDYDVASIARITNDQLFFMASPDNGTQRYLYKKSLNSDKKPKRVTPIRWPGINKYNISPNGRYAMHVHKNVSSASTTRLVSLRKHQSIKLIVENKKYSEQLAKLRRPKVIFEKLPISAGYEVDARIILPVGFDETKKYPVLFHVYGEPWGQVAQDAPIGLWNTMLAQKGYVIVDIDNRGTPCLQGSEWRKSIYRKIGVINTSDQAEAAELILKKKYIDRERTAVWGWSGGGSMTLNLMFKYPELYKTGIAIAAVSNQLIYDNAYQERYMGLPQENEEDFINGSPVTYAKNLQGNLLLIHGTADDNVHYQSAEILINELIRTNRQFEMMSYPNRSHGIYEGKNTRRHLYSLMTKYLLENTPVNSNKT